MNDTTRSPILAFVLGLVAPGLGLVFAGRGLAGIALALAWIAGGAGVAAWVMSSDPTLFARAHLAFSASAVFGSAVVSALFARRPSPKKGYEHLWWVLGFALVAWGANNQLRERVVAYEIGFVLRVWDDSMNPGFAMGDLMVVNARETADVGDVVLVERAAPDEAPVDVPTITLARVVARQGQSVRIDDGRLFIDEVQAQESPCRTEEIRAPGLACVAQTLAGMRIVVGGEGCTVPLTSVAAGQLFVAPDARTKEACGRAARLVQKTDVRGVVFRAR